MSQKATRKSQNVTPISEEKEKVDTPVKEMKKKIAANAEKDKQAAEKAEKPTEKTEPADKNKPAEKADKIKPAEKVEKNKPAEKSDKNVEKTDKNGEKTDKNEKLDNKDKAAEKKTDKSEKAVEKKTDKSSDKKPVEKKSETQVDKDESKGDKAKEKPSKPVNGTHNGSASNGDDLHGTVSEGSDDDELFPELTYDDSDSDVDEAPSRSLTRRSQMKATKTPDTPAPAPRPASERESDDSKEPKAAKSKDDSVSSDRKLRSSDSPKPEAKKLEKKANEAPLAQDAAQDEKKATKKELETVKEADDESVMNDPRDGKTVDKSGKMEMEVVIEVESMEGSAPRTRARVSPYSRNRLDRTITSVMADYTGNNSTMEMDITESSSLLEDPSLNDSGYLRGLRGIRGRTSYKVLTELKLTNPNAGRARPAPAAATVRPTGAVVGRKRKPSTDVTLGSTSTSTYTASATATPLSGVEAGEEVSEDIFLAHGKRMKLLDRLALPFRRSITSRPAEIVGINTDLPLTAPVASTSFATFDPESMKPAPPTRSVEPVATPLVGGEGSLDRDNKRCVVM